ncbi:MAG TPA: hypothetical protein VK510_10665 [Solirubrobacteraceae bacterium]|nr:hypothetical protein [Solirubrobacteraceae bacterium]
MLVGDLGVPVGDEKEQRRALGPADEVAQRHGGGVFSPVQVLEEQNRGARACGVSYEHDDRLDKPRGGELLQCHCAGSDGFGELRHERSQHCSLGAEPIPQRLHRACGDVAS